MLTKREMPLLIKVFGSRIYVGNSNTELSTEYISLVSDLLYSEPVKALADWGQHKHVNRLQHSVSVSYYSFLICRKLGLDYRAAARAGLLHDLYFFSRKELGLGAAHIKLHPRAALKNAEILTDLDDMERDIIAKHMWPLGGRAKYKETLVVSYVDKMCALTEYSDYVRLYIKGLGCPLRG